MKYALGVVFVCAFSAPLFGQSKQFRGEILEFSASWCGPCQTMSPVVKKLQRKGMPLRKIDIEQFPSLTRNYAVKSIPTFVLLIDGKEADRIVGATTESRLVGLLARIPKSAPARTTNASNPKSKAAGAPTDNKSLLAKVNGLVRSRSPEGSAQSSKPPVVRGQNPDRQIQPASDSRLASSVRLRIRDAKGTGYGTGTIVLSKPGRTVILTCGHVFRGWSSASKLDVDVFGSGRSETFVGKVLDYDIKAEVGLLQINTASVLPFAPIASLESVTKSGDDVYSVGCGHGNNPTVENHQVTGIDRYRGFDNIECSGAPVQGRSGGGLFNDKGAVIGTCIGYMDVGGGKMRGLYSGIRAIHRMLDRNELTHLYRGVEPADFDHLIAQPNASSAPALPVNSLGHSGRARENESPNIKPIPSDVKTVDANGPRAAGSGRTVEVNVPAEDLPNLNAALQRAIATASDAEVVCVIRPRDGSASRVVIIDHASDRFVSLLKGELRKSAVQTVKRVSGDTSRRTDEKLVAFAESTSNDSSPVDSPSDSSSKPTIGFKPRRYVRRRN